MPGLVMKSLSRVLGGTALMILGVVVARMGCVALMYGFYGGSISSILLGILGIAVLGVGVYLFVKGWNW
jgi:hypothetical protein